MNLIVRPVSRNMCAMFILDIHYAKRWPSISYAYGLFDGEELIGVCTFGSPASPSLCIGVCGIEYKKKVLELNRLCLKYNRKNEASFLVGNSLKKIGDYVIVSYADSNQNHLGVVYQATNFIFTGTTKKRTDMASLNGKHSRHSMGDKTKRVVRHPKHRYVTFTGNKRFKRNAKVALKYSPMPYPKTGELR